MTSWFTTKDLAKHRKNTTAWLNCKTENERKHYVSVILVRWSEMLRLPYHDPIKHLIINPMHCLFLSITQWIVKRLWIDSGKITYQQLEEMKKMAK
jgi:hypothetical protein